MKLYYHPASTTSRPLALFIPENGLKLDMQVVDLFTGEQYKPAFEAINPNHMVPVLEDGDFRLTESSAILKYLADAFNSPLYPKDLKQRARVNERMDWVRAATCAMAWCIRRFFRSTSAAAMRRRTPRLNGASNARRAG